MDTDAHCEVCGTAFKKKYKAQRCCSVACGNKAKRVDRTCKCESCGNSFERPHGKKDRRFCSRSCAMSGRVRSGQIKSHPEGTVLTHMHGYLVEKRDGKWVMQHRLVMEVMLGSAVPKGMRIHHKNGKRDDNRPENLELWTGVDGSKKDPHGVRLVDKVLDMIGSLTEGERESVLRALAESA